MTERVGEKRKRQIREAQRRYRERIERERFGKCPKCGEELVEPALGCGFCALDEGDDRSLEPAA